jgi:hypothetical protein
MPAIQDFSVPQGDDMDVVFNLDPTDQISLTGATVTWAAFEQNFAVPTSLASGGEVILKASTALGQITILPSPLQFIVHLASADTISLPPGNYYHEAAIQDVNGNRATVTQGMMAVTLAMIA